MLSKLSKLVMGLLHKRPMNPYEVIRLAEMDPVKSWFPMTATSIYTTIRNLEKSGCITGETVQEGRLPPKTVYSLTQSGEDELLRAFSHDLAGYEAEASSFGVALFHIGSLPTEEALACAKSRIEAINAILADIVERLARFGETIPFNMRMMLRYRKYKLEMEINMTKELITEIESDKTWDTSFVRYLDK